MTKPPLTTNAGFIVLFLRGGQLNAVKLVNVGNKQPRYAGSCAFWRFDPAYLKLNDKLTLF